MIGIYARISGDKAEGEDRSIDYQISEGQRFAESKGLDYRVYTDENVSGTTAPEDREGLSALLLDITRGDLTALWVWHEQRLYRAEEVRFKVFATIIKHNAKLYVGNKEYDFDNPQDKLLSSIMAATGQFYVDLTKKAVKGVIQKNIQEGKVHGRIPFGYDKDENNYLIPHQNNAKIISLIFTKASEGTPINDIVRELNRLGIKSMFGQWTKSSLTKLLTNTQYYGVRRLGDSTVQCPALISKDLFDRARKAIKANAITRGALVPDRFYLNGLVKCGNCGSNYLGVKNKYPHYQCTTKRDNPKDCANINVRSTFLEQVIWFALTKTFKEMIDASTTNDQGRQELENKLAQVKAELQEKDDEERRLARSVSKGILSDAIASETAKEIKSSREALNGLKIDLSDQLKAYNKPSLELLDNLGNMNEVPAKTRKQIAKEFIQSITVVDDEVCPRLEITYKYQEMSTGFYFNAKRGIAVQDILAPVILLTGKMIKAKYEKDKDNPDWYNQDPDVYFMRFLAESSTKGDVLGSTYFEIDESGEPINVKTVKQLGFKDYMTKGIATYVLD